MGNELPKNFNDQLQRDAIRVDLASHTVIPIGRVPEILGRNITGRKVSMAAVYRWMQQAGMPFLQLPHGRVTSVVAIQEWAEARTRRVTAAPIAVSRGRQQAIERAATEAALLLGAGWPRESATSSSALKKS